MLGWGVFLSSVGHPCPLGLQPSCVHGHELCSRSPWKPPPSQLLWASVPSLCPQRWPEASPSSAHPSVSALEESVHGHARLRRKVACREETYTVHWKGAGIGHPNRQVCTAPVCTDEHSGAPRASQANEGLWASVTGCGERRRGKAHRVPLSQPRSLTSESGRLELPTLDLTLGAQRP